MKEKLFNLWLAFNYNNLNPVGNKKFTGEVVFEKGEFRLSDLEGSFFEIKDQEFYNTYNNWFDRKMISIRGNGCLSIRCEYNPAEHTSWQGTRKVDWVAGMIQTPVLLNYGVWEIEAKVPNGFPAIWLLREGHINQDGIATITPEVDIMEVISGKFQHTIHHTPTKDRYSTDGANNRLKYDNEFHKFAVDLRKDGYDFYIDRILTARFRGGSRSVSDKMLYLIINSAAPNGWKDDPIGDLEIRSIVVRKNEFTTVTGYNREWRK